MRLRRPSYILLAALFALPGTVYAGTTTTPQIVAQTAGAALSCMRWMPIGICFWLRCSWSGCSVKTSLKVGHYNPDLVVSAYNELGANPWAEIRATLGLAQRAAATGLLGALMPVPVDSAGNRTEGSSGHRDHKNLVFRETDAIGHPVGSLSGIAAGAGLLCPSQTAPFFPYFQSGLDALARALKAFTDSRTGKRKGRKVGFPVFKSRARARASWAYTTGAFGVADPYGAKLPRIGRVHTLERVDTGLRDGRVLRLTVAREGGRWYAIFTVERPTTRPCC